MDLESLGSLMGLRPMSSNPHVHEMHMDDPPLWEGYFGIFLTLYQYCKTMFGKAKMVSENQTKSRFIEPRLDLIVLLRRRKVGVMWAHSLYQDQVKLAIFLFCHIVMSRFIVSRWVELVMRESLSHMP